MASKKQNRTSTGAAPPKKTPLVDYPCVEGGIWTPISENDLPKDQSHRLKLKDIDPDESQRVKKRGNLTFHAVGCSGCFKPAEPGLLVGQAMAAQIDDPKVYGGSLAANSPSFFFHLGDIVYKEDDKDPPQDTDGQGNADDGENQELLYAKQFYAQYDRYKRNIFAVPGNHDSKKKKHAGRSAIAHFLDNFCDSKRRSDQDAAGNWRRTMTQPYPYWLLETPVAFVIGLATNDINGGPLDDPMGPDEPQYQWLLQTLVTIRNENEARIQQKSPPKAVLLALHYPPFSGMANFAQRGDPNLGPTPRPNPRKGNLQPLGVLLHRAFHATQQYPDAVLSAHAHLYQRISYTFGSGHQIPYLVAGSGGHAPVEKLNETCWKNLSPVSKTPFDVVLPPGLSIPSGDKAQVVCYNDQDFGFLRLTVDPAAGTMTGEFFVVGHDSKSKSGATPPKLADAFVLDLRTHVIKEVRPGRGKTF